MVLTAQSLLLNLLTRGIIELSRSLLQWDLLIRKTFVMAHDQRAKQSQTHSTRKVHSLLDITRSLQTMIRQTYTGNYWVRAEVAKLNFYKRSGHCYPDLVEKQKGKVMAQMRGIIWANDYQEIRKKFEEIIREPLREGITILFLAKLQFHPSYGLSLNILKIDPSYTLGEMAREKKATIERLKKEELYAKNSSLPFPELPKRIAVVSVETSKGYSDFCKTLLEDTHPFAFEHKLFPALLQGDRAVSSIRRQLVRINGERDHFDVVAIIRGGGGDVGLSCYDNYSLAREVALCPLPVITGIGHSTNETVVEMIAHLNKITPTEVAYFLIKSFRDFADRVERSRERICKRIQDRINIEKQTLNDFSNRMQVKPLQLVSSAKKELENKGKFVLLYGENVYNKARQSIDLLEGKVRLMDPEKVLERGFSITYMNGKVLNDPGDIKKGDLVRTEFYNGSITSRVTTIKKKDGK